MNFDFWNGKIIFISGHTGFKGSWLSLLLKKLGAEVHGYALAPPTEPNIFTQVSLENEINSITGDIRNIDHLGENISKIQPDIVIHMAAQSLVRESYKDPLNTYSTNIMGTVNILEVCRHIKSIKALINITTDKCYKNNEQDIGYTELDELGGFEPYSASKACSELITSSYNSSFYSSTNDTNIATARAGNVIGGGDWSNDRLIPDLIRGFIEGNEIKIRNPDAIRPWQHVLDPLTGYLALAESLYNSASYSGAWNFGPELIDEKPVKWIADTCCRLWGNDQSWLLDGENQPHETHILRLNCSKSKSNLNWKPSLDIESALDLTIRWYKEYRANGDLKAITLKQIDEYIEQQVK